MVEDSAQDGAGTSETEPILPVDPHILTVNVFKNHRIYISKPLILLKLTFFLYYGAGSFVNQFITVLYKERGVSLSEISVMTMIAPFFQFIGTALSGIITDKIGKSKPVCAFNILITAMTVVGIILLPNIDTKYINLTCHQSNSNEVEAWTSCGTIKEIIEIDSCHGYCLDKFTDQCLSEHLECEIFDYSKELNASLIIYINNTYLQRIKDVCQYNVLSITRGNLPYSWCSDNQNYHCALFCTAHSQIKIVDGISGLLIAYGFIYILFLTTFSTSFRCLDVTCMFLVEEYHSSYGRERFFAVLGYVFISPLAGYLAYITAPTGRERNYCSALYLYLALCFIMLPILFKLPMRVRPGEKNMWQKCLILLKKLNAWIFVMTLIVLGTAYNLGRNFLFWYLEEMKASPLLLGLIISLSALYGLPFLLFSKKIVEKIGSTQIFLLAFLGYTINATGYTFLKDPWLSLILESTGILTYYLLWVAAVQYSKDIAPEGLTATIIAAAGAVHFSIGKVPAGLIGMFIMHPYGGSVAFAFSAIMTLIGGVLYGSYLCALKFRTEEQQLNSSETRQQGTFPAENNSRFVSDEEKAEGGYINPSFQKEPDQELENEGNFSKKIS